MIPRGEGGFATILVLGACVLCFAIAGLAVDGMRVLIERRALQALADSAARAGAGQLDLGEVYGGKMEAGLEPGEARRRAAEMVAGRRVDRASISVSNDTVLVEVHRAIDASFLQAVGIRTLPVSASAAAEPVFGEL